MTTDAHGVPRPRLGFLASVCRGADDVGDAALSPGKCCSSPAFSVQQLCQQNSRLTYGNYFY